MAKESNKLMKDLAHLTVPGSEQVSVVEREGGGGVTVLMDEQKGFYSAK